MFPDCCAPQTRDTSDFRVLARPFAADVSVGSGEAGIVFAGVAFDAGIISRKFYTTLVLAAILTSQVAGSWLEYVCVRAGRYSVLLLKPGRQFSPRLNFLVHPEAFDMNRASVEAS